MYAGMAGVVAAVADPCTYVKLPRGQPKDNVCSHKHLCFSVHGNFIGHHPKLETTQLPFPVGTVERSGAPTPGDNSQRQRTSLVTHTAVWMSPRGDPGRMRESHSQRVHTKGFHVYDSWNDTIIEREHRVVVVRFRDRWGQEVWLWQATGGILVTMGMCHCLDCRGEGRSLCT